jgi:hypothetical protein
MRSGDLRGLVGFYQKVSADDGYGNTDSGYSPTAAFTVAANIRPKLGSEQVLAQRLSGTNLANVTVRRSSQTVQVDTSWKLKDERSGEEYNIRSVIDPEQGSSRQGRWIEMLCEKGVAL